MHAVYYLEPTKLYALLLCHLDNLIEKLFVDFHPRILNEPVLKERQCRMVGHPFIGTYTQKQSYAEAVIRQLLYHALRYIPKIAQEKHLQYQSWIIWRLANLSLALVIGQELFRESFPFNYLIELPQEMAPRYLLIVEELAKERVRRSLFASFFRHRLTSTLFYGELS